MKVQWTILIITALTDLIISSGGALSAAMLATGSATMPNNAAILFALVSGLVIAARTVQQALKATPDTIANLTGQPQLAAKPTGK